MSDTWKTFVLLDVIDPEEDEYVLEQSGGMEDPRLKAAYTVCGKVLSRSLISCTWFELDSCTDEDDIVNLGGKVSADPSLEGLVLEITWKEVPLEDKARAWFKDGRLLHIHHPRLWTWCDYMESRGGVPL